MKKLLIMIMLLLGGAFYTNAIAEEPEDIPLYIINEDGVDKGNTKAPSVPMYITQDNHILALPATPVDYTLQIRDANDTVVYSEYIPAGTTQIILPSSLTGNFEIRLVTDTYYYQGYITL